MLKAWFKRRKQQKELEAFKHGQAYGLFEVIINDRTPEDIEYEVYPPGNSIDAFDKGVLDAVQTLIDMKVVEDDRDLYV